MNNNNAVNEVENQTETNQPSEVTTQMINRKLPSVSEKKFRTDPVKMYAGSDLGGTNSRTIQLYKGKDFEDGDLLVIPSSYAILDEFDGDTSVIKATSSNIEDNLEVRIIEDPLTAQNKPSSLFAEEVTVLKGSLLSNSNSIKMDINNQHDKMDDIGIYVNHLVNLAILAYKGNCVDVNFNTGVTLPVTERYSNSERLGDFITRLSGVYNITLPRLDYKVKITIERDNVIVESEAETAYYFLVTDQAENETIQEAVERNIVINDMGKTTYNMSLITQGAAASGKSRTAKYGGDNLVAQLHDELMREFPEAIEYEQAERALETGYLELGSSKKPVGSLVTRVKRNGTKHMISENLKFLQRSTMQATQIYLNVFIGRTMGSTGTVKIDEETGEKIYSPDFSPSIGQMFTEMFKKYSSSSQGYILDNPGTATILGLALALVADWDLE